MPPPWGGTAEGATREPFTTRTGERFRATVPRVTLAVPSGTAKLICRGTYPFAVTLSLYFPGSIRNFPGFFVNLNTPCWSTQPSGWGFSKQFVNFISAYCCVSGLRRNKAITVSSKGGPFEARDRSVSASCTAPTILSALGG